MEDYDGAVTVADVSFGAPDVIGLGRLRQRVAIPACRSTAHRRLDRWVKQRVVHACQERLRRKWLAQGGASPQPERLALESPSVVARCHDHGNEGVGLLDLRDELKAVESARAHEVGDHQVDGAPSGDRNACSLVPASNTRNPDSSAR